MATRLDRFATPSEPPGAWRWAMRFRDGGRVGGDVPSPTTGPEPASGDGASGPSGHLVAPRLVPFTVELTTGGEVELVSWTYGPNGETRLEDRNLLDADGNRYRLVGSNLAEPVV